MKKAVWILGVVVVALLVTGGIYGLQAKRSGRPVAIASILKSHITVPSGTALAMRLQTTISTKTANVGDRFQATVTAPVRVNGRVAIPTGAEVSGHVVVAEQPGKAGGRGQLQLAYDHLRFDGDSYALGSRSQVYLSRSGTKKDVEMIGGGAVAGGVVGGILGGGSGAVKGAVVGGAAGTGAALLTRGPQLEMESGTPLRTHLVRSMRVQATKQTV
jgi:hypothetical protein